MHRSVSAHLIWTTAPSHWRQRHLSPPSGKIRFHTNFQRCDKKPEPSPQPRVDQITLLCYWQFTAMVWVQWTVTEYQYICCEWSPLYGGCAFSLVRYTLNKCQKKVVHLHEIKNKGEWSCSCCFFLSIRSINVICVLSTETGSKCVLIVSDLLV